MVTGTTAFSHPACQGDPAVLAKLIEVIDRHIPYLMRKAEIIEEYLQQR